MVMTADQVSAAANVLSSLSGPAGLFTAFIKNRATVAQYGLFFLRHKVVFTLVHRQWINSSVDQ